MMETIYTIPINEAYDLKQGCPLCKLAADLDQSSLEFIMGPAMMEPDVRIEVNRLGFCAGHYMKMLNMRNRLSLALMLESHLCQIEEELKKESPDRKRFFTAGGNGANISKTAKSCFICLRVERFFTQYLKNIVYLWDREPEFRDKFLAQQYYCFEHYGRLLEYSETALSVKRGVLFSGDMRTVELNWLGKTKELISAFCRSFDYRYSESELGDAKDAVERAIDFLSGSR